MRGAGLSVPRSTTSWPSACTSWITRSRNLTPRWSKATATRIGPLRYPHDRARALARAGTAAAGRFDPRGRRHQVRPPDLVDVGGRPDGRPAGEVPALRLRPPGRPAERPPGLLQGPRLAALILALQGSRRRLGRGAAHLPRARQPAPGPPDPGDPVGR